MRKLLANKSLIGLGLSLLFYAVIQITIVTGALDSYYQFNLIQIFIFIIMAVSLNLINGFTGQFSIGHAGFMAIGAYVSAIITTKLGLPFFLGIFAGAIVAAIVGFLIGLPTLRLKGDYLAIATLGFGEIIRVLFNNIEYVGGASGFSGITPLTNWTWTFFLTLFTVYFIRNFINSTHGRACISVREDEIAAETMGINTTKYKVMAFTIGAFFAGIGGALYAHQLMVITPVKFGFQLSIDFLVMVVLGGMGSISGSILAAVVLTILNAYLQSFAELRMILYAIVLIVVMLFRPQGLMGNKELSLRMFKRLGRGPKENGAAVNK